MKETNEQPNNAIESSTLLECLLCHNKEAYIMKCKAALDTDIMLCEVYCPHCCGLFGWAMEEEETIAELKKHSNAKNEGLDAPERNS